MEKVTYTKNQLSEFTVKELKTLPLFEKINPKGLDKAGIVDAMFKAQSDEIAESKEEDKIESTPKVEDSSDESNDKAKEENENEEVQSGKSEKIVFHRNNNKSRNPMTFR